MVWEQVLFTSGCTGSGFPLSAHLFDDALKCDNSGQTGDAAADETVVSVEGQAGRVYCQFSQHNHSTRLVHSHIKSESWGTFDETGQNRGCSDVSAFRYDTMGETIHYSNWYYGLALRFKYIPMKIILFLKFEEKNFELLYKCLYF